MSQTTSNKQPALIGALSGSLVLAIGAAGFLYLQKDHTDNTNPSASVQQAADSTSEAPGAKVAFKALFGSEYPGKPVKTDGDKLTQPGFSRNFVHDGKQYHTEVFYSQLLDEAGKPLEDEAQGVLLSAANYVKTDKGWETLSRQKYFTELGKYNIAPSDKDHEFTELKLSNVSTALLSEQLNGKQGYNDTYTNVMVFIDTGWVDAGSVQTAAESPCEKDNNELTEEERAYSPPCYSFTSTIELAKSSNEFFPDLIIHRKGTQLPENGEQPIPAKTERYQYRYGRYVVQE